MYDVVIRGGDIIDGTGAPRRSGDVAIADGRVVAVGDVPDPADTRQTIDASGAAVCPGFVDVHTHIDAQVFWDPTVGPSPLHGVTTALAGNCGFTIAPLSADPADGEYLKRMLARVEGMPLESLEIGVPWGEWTTTGEYLDAVQRRDPTINLGFMVGHSAIRRVVMGEAAHEREATADELAAMSRLLDDGLAAGGLGFSSSWARTHNDADGHMVPSRYASRAEVIELCRVVNRHAGTSLEFIPTVGPMEQQHFDLMADMSVAAGRQLNWNVLSVNAANVEHAYHQLKAGDVARAKGGKVVALTVPMGFGLRLSFASGFVLDALPDWEEVMLLPRAEKMRRLADPAERRRLDALAKSEPGPLRGMSKWDGYTIFDVKDPQNERFRNREVGDIAAELGVDPFDALLDIALADELLTSFGRGDPEQSRADWEARIGVWRDGRAVIGASDAGAHLDLFGTFNYTTRLLAGAVREHELISLEEAVHLLTQVPADLYGLRDRGRLAPGFHGDVVIVDETAIGSDPLSMRYDLPGGIARLYAEATGIRSVLCNGVEIVADGAYTDARPGTVLRSGRDTATASLI